MNDLKSLNHFISNIFSQNDVFLFINKELLCLEQFISSILVTPVQRYLQLKFKIILFFIINIFPQKIIYSLMAAKNNKYMFPLVEN